MWVQLDVVASKVEAFLSELTAEGLPQVDVTEVLPSLPKLLGLDPLDLLKGSAFVKFAITDLTLVNLKSKPHHVSRADGTQATVNGKFLGVVARVESTVTGLPTPVLLPPADATFRLDVVTSDDGITIMGDYESFKFTSSAVDLATELIQLHKSIDASLADASFEQDVDLASLYSALDMDPKVNPIANVAITPRGLGKVERVSLILDIAPITTPVAVAADVWGVLLSTAFKSPGDPGKHDASITVWYDMLNHIIKNTLRGLIHTAIKDLHSMVGPTTHWITNGAENFTFDHIFGTVEGETNMAGGQKLKAEYRIHFSVAEGQLRAAAHGRLLDIEGQSPVGDIVETLLEAGMSLFGADGTFDKDEDIDLQIETPFGTFAPGALNVLLFNSHFHDPKENFNVVVKVDESVLPLEPQPGCFTIAGDLVQVVSAKSGKLPSGRRRHGPLGGVLRRPQ
ncbi:MAG TPA: hypothetical protein VFB78_14640 [Acidimicrobiales bacterium]|nr:hypothetical protein [Acidimicrobiales bacterium]